ncbi:Ribosome associating protein [Komagataella phaffii CBS 7435]|uniref:Translation machinery-associated protein 16 n=2 Tax=Komagataella phaffii TaxID=460519 RepID=C4QVG8_KOMPG|nr:uncharacterized protein PAS_chr1-3_0178 [Komagataella phaffii GS115]AOA60511.1 GQ67_02433T0 [Komagataella phaffii]CAH2445897.1 Ribosome associating protein [Komagataella phaffii CBS 7435]AOA66724.1 GQ68_02814T0 [Komagataella phaffii GS115]CAY67241.1 Protein of unknown function that associates with ribosomes [Komagataella phaffii GS115]CCA36345.1 Ribosome associating protein [Komagataella phaffii CBS 7435]
MPIGKSLRKVTKNISKSKSAIHPKGRKFKQLTRASLREKKIAAKKELRSEQKQNDLLIVAFFQDSILETSRLDTKIFTIDDMKAFIETFIARDDQELQDLKDSRRPGRPASNKQMLLEARREQECGFYSAGWSVPDLTNEENVQRLRAWEGSFGGVTSLKFVSVSEKSQ